MRQNKIAQKLFMGKAEGKRDLGRSRLINDDIKMAPY
jgi:hypothetical protein